MLGARFWTKADLNGPMPTHRPSLGPCWLWVGARVPGGYGTYRVGRKMRRAHVVAWEDVNGPVPGGLELDHLCRVRHCCRPDHLDPVTHLENVRRGEGGLNHSTKTHCRIGHAFDEANTYVHRGRRSCRRCNRECQQRRSDARKAA